MTTERKRRIRKAVTSATAVLGAIIVILLVQNALGDQAAFLAVIAAFLILSYLDRENRLRKQEETSGSKADPEVKAKEAKDEQQPPPTPLG